jgi:membrane associated rhomboid family serine protease
MEPQDLPQDFETQMPDDIKVEHCYRHPDRETGVSCSNCGRPICYECMIPAAVGFRCPECVREQRGEGRTRVITRAQTRSRWQGGLLGTAGWSATKVLVALNVIFFVVELATGATTLFGGGNMVEMVRLGALVPAYVGVKHEYWRLFSVMFLHDGILHIGLNMWALLVIGNFVESAVGRLKFVILYLVSGFAGSVLVIVAAPVFQPTVGASGAIFGIFGALALYAYLNRRRDTASRALLGNIVFLLVINLAFTFANRAISWEGHIGGLLGGVAVMGVMMLGGRKDPRAPFAASDVLGVLAVVVVLVAVAWWRVATFTL